MNLDELVAALRQVGLQSEVAPTGHPEYVRVYVKTRSERHNNELITLGRATVHRGVYTHTKWYYLNKDNVFHMQAFYHYLRTGKMLTREQWKNVQAKAVMLAKARYDEKVQWRRDNPHPQGKNRGRLTHPSPAGYIQQLLGELT